MPKSSKEQIIEDEKMILQELENNSKKSIDNISKKCGFSRQKTMRVIKYMEKKNQIWGYHAVVDDNIMKRKRFFILIKRSQKPATEEKINIMINRDLKKTAAEQGVEIEDSYYVHGFYDWFMCITAPDIKQVKAFCNSISKVFNGSYLSNIHILDVLFPIERNGFNNPNLEELKDFF
jgi:DNA-binding Lrp family transcriptional regulator